jgi:hypothetical protein
MRSPPYRWLTLLPALVLSASALAADAPPDPLRATTLKLIEALVEQGVLTREKADALIREANQPSPAAAPVAGTPVPGDGTPPPGTVRVPYVPEFVRQELKEEIRSDLLAEAQKDGWAPPGAVPDWVRKMRWEGDLRVRIEHDSFGDNNAPEVNIMSTNTNRSLTLSNVAKSVDRERVRARLGMVDDLDENAQVGIRLSTGSSTNPVSENQTLGNYDNRLTTTLDRAYLKYQSADLGSVTVGRFENPFVSTELMWAADLSFDGVVGKLQPNFGWSTKPFLTFLASPVQEIDLGTHNKYLFAWQGGVDQPLGDSTMGHLALSYYRYTGIEGVVSPLSTSLYEYTAPVFAQQGNTYYNISSDPTRPLLGLASSFHIAELVGSLDTHVYGPYHAILTGDYVKNLAFNEKAVSERVGVDVTPKTSGYLIRLMFGTPQINLRNDWQVYATYKHVERDAVLDAFTDSDFHLGGTDAKGYVIGGSYGLTRNTWAAVRYYSTDSINGAPLAIDTVMFDLNARF